MTDEARDASDAGDAGVAARERFKHVLGIDTARTFENPGESPGWSLRFVVYDTEALRSACGGALLLAAQARERIARLAVAGRR